MRGSLVQVLEAPFAVVHDERIGDRAQDVTYASLRDFRVFTRRDEGVVRVLELNIELEQRCRLLLELRTLPLELRVGAFALRDIHAHADDRAQDCRCASLSTVPRASTQRVDAIGANDAVAQTVRRTRER